MKKRIIALLLGALMLCGTLTAFAEDASLRMENFIYDITDYQHAYYRHYALLTKDSCPVVCISPRTESQLYGKAGYTGEFVLFTVPPVDSYCSEFYTHSISFEDVASDREINYSFKTSVWNYERFLGECKNPGMIVLDGSEGAAAYLDPDRGIAHALIAMSDLSDGDLLYVTISLHSYQSMEPAERIEKLDAMIRAEVSRIRAEAEVVPLDQMWTQDIFSGISITPKMANSFKLELTLPEITFHTAVNGEITGRMFITSCFYNGFHCYVRQAEGQAVSLSFSIDSFSMYEYDGANVTDYTLSDGNVWGIYINKENENGIRHFIASRRIGENDLGSTLYQIVEVDTGTDNYEWPDRETAIGDLETILQSLSLTMQ